MLTLFRDHNGSLLRRHPGAMTTRHSPKGKEIPKPKVFFFGLVSTPSLNEPSHSAELAVRFGRSNFHVDADVPD